MKYVLIIFLMLIIGCDNIKTSDQDRSNNETLLSKEDSVEDFYSFIEIFKADTIFQKRRIAFPISTIYRKSPDNDIVTVVDTETDWIPLNYYLPEDLKQNYSNKYYHKNDTIIHELREIGYRLNTNYIFTLKHQKWFLVQIDDKTKW